MMYVVHSGDKIYLVRGVSHHEDACDQVSDTTGESTFSMEPYSVEFDENGVALIHPPFKNPESPGK